MSARTSQLQIRVTPEEKAALRRLAAEAGESISAYVLGRVLPTVELELAVLLAQLTQPGVDHRLTLRELSDTLERLPGSRLAQMTPPPDPASTPPLVLNCVAAMVETAAHRREVEPPSWVRDIPALSRPHFGWGLRSLRPHQVRVAPVPFKRRNVFFDPATGPLP